MRGIQVFLPRQTDLKGAGSSSSGLGRHNPTAVDPLVDLASLLGSDMPCFIELQHMAIEDLDNIRFKCSGHPAGPTELWLLVLGFGDLRGLLLGCWLSVVACWVFVGCGLVRGWLVADGWLVGRSVAWLVCGCCCRRCCLLVVVLLLLSFLLLSGLLEKELAKSTCYQFCFVLASRPNCSVPPVFGYVGGGWRLVAGRLWLRWWVGGSVVGRLG